MGSRSIYIDNIRIFLTALVVLHHLAISYGAPGGWFYVETVAGPIEGIPLSMFVATNQAFFMGMFFFISAYFMGPSLEKKGPRKYIADRFIRLGIPTVIYFFLLFPLTIYVVNNFVLDDEVSLTYLISHGEVGFGPMWFVEALMLFSLVYVLFQILGGQKKWEIAAPGPGKIIATAILVGVGQFIIRIWLPVGWSLPFTNFQLPHFLQYITLFAFGSVAYKMNWFESLDQKSSWKWFVLVQILVFVVFPLIFILGGALENGPEAFVGGFTWQNLAYAIWEQLVGFGLVVALLGIFKFRFNTQGMFAQKLSASAYSTYVIHSVVLVSINALFLWVDQTGIVKFTLLAPIALMASFGVGYLLKSLPLLRRIL